MFKKLSMLTAFIFTVLLLPISNVLAAGGGGEEGHAAEAAATSDLLFYSLAVLSIVTLVYMCYLMFTDNN